MIRRQYRLSLAVAAVVVAVCAVNGLLLLQTVRASLRGAGAEDLLRTVQPDLLGALIVAMLLALAVALLATRALVGTLRDTRAALLAGARGDAAEPPHFAVLEMEELASAGARLLARANARELELEKSALGVGTLLDSISEGIVQLDEGGRIVRANPAARALLGLNAASTGVAIATVVRHVELRAVLQRAGAGETVDSAEVIYHDRRLLVSARPMRNAPAPGTRGGAVVSFIDLTEIRRLESVRRDFVANVSHELKTPLTSIRGYAETLLTDEALPPAMQRQFLEIVHRNADRLHRIVDDLLDLSRIESGAWRPELQNVDISALVDDVWSNCSAAAAQRRIRFQPPDDAMSVSADPGALRHVLGNLLENAVRYTPDGGRIEVAVCPARAGRNGQPFVSIEVRDNGVGIPSDALTRIFERFYRVDPARSRAQGGTGLGLSIVKHLVEGMGGDVAAESELGRGTTIRVRLPEAT